MTRTTRTLGIFALAIATVITLGASSAFAGSCSSSAATTAKANIVNTAAEAGSFQTLIAAAKAAGLAGAVGLEDVITVLGRDAGAIVAHLDLHPARNASRVDPDVPGRLAAGARGERLPGVVHDVQKDLL